jgi:hypothetical protein
LIKTLGFLLALAAAFAQAPQQPARGSVSGVVRDASSGAPMANVQVVDVRNLSRRSDTDSQGRYKLGDLLPGEYNLVAVGPNLESTQARVSVGPGQDVENFDIRLMAFGTITGRVLDENKEPLPGMRVFLVERTYRLGELHYSHTSFSVTNDKGEYWLPRAAPGRAYLIFAKKWGSALEGTSEAPAEPKLRKRALASTYYPNAAILEAAEPVTILPGETRENVDIRVAHTPSYCIDGVVNHPSPSFWIVERYPSLVSLPTDFGMIGSILPPSGKAGAGGKFRTCDLHPDQYLFTAFGSFGERPPAAVIVPLTISDSDIHNLSLTPAPGPPLRGEVVWDTPPPRDRPEATVTVELRSLAQNIPGAFGLSEEAKVPGPFRMDHVLVDEYAVLVRNLPKGSYLKDVTYGGLSILNKAMKIGTAVGQAELRIVLGRDGGLVTAEVSDDEGKPIPQVTVLIAPAEARSEAEFAAAITAGLTDQTGVFLTGALAPRKYFALAIGSRLDYSPETIGRLFRARIKAKEVEVGAGQTVQVKLEAPVE